MFRKLMGAVVGLAVAGMASAVNAATLTGAELYALQPIVSFPSVGGTVEGDSLKFDSTTAILQKIFVIPILTPASGYSVSMNLTRLTADHDPHLVIGDGTNWVGVGAYDPLNGGGAGGDGFGVNFEDDGASAVKNKDPTTLFLQTAAYPDVGDDFTINVLFSLSLSGTTVDLSYGGSSGTFNSSVVLSPTPLYLALVGEDASEKYQINSISINPVPIPAALPLFASALGAMSLIGWRRRRS